MDKIFCGGGGTIWGAIFWPPALALAPGRFFHGTAPQGAENGGPTCDFGRFGARFRRILTTSGDPAELLASMSCAYLYVNNFFSARLAWELHTGASPQRRRERRGKIGLGERRNDGGFTAAGHGRIRSPARENAEDAEKDGDWGKADGETAKALTAENAEHAEGGRVKRQTVCRKEGHREHAGSRGREGALGQGGGTGALSIADWGLRIGERRGTLRRRSGQALIKFFGSR